ncbi:hypothetical protein EVAR_92179_1 [Eumeta japonica]|uniref:Uncharacterized protein n=1 Tax=Eumeta variegata TaxID=151549 RepID=A0A4C2A908_EUMVA|nr:hypothetical protein EVAR_92179_1 [Eumeta japonica]
MVINLDVGYRDEYAVGKCGQVACKRVRTHNAARAVKAAGSAFALRARCASWCITKQDGLLLALENSSVHFLLQYPDPGHQM